MSNEKKVKLPEWAAKWFKEYQVWYDEYTSASTTDDDDTGPNPPTPPPPPPIPGKP